MSATIKDAQPAQKLGNSGLFLQSPTWQMSGFTLSLRVSALLFQQALAPLMYRMMCIYLMCMPPLTPSCLHPWLLCRTFFSHVIILSGFSVVFIAEFERLPFSVHPTPGSITLAF